MFYFILGFILGVSGFFVALVLLPKQNIEITHIPLIDEEGRMVSRLEISPSKPSFFIPTQYKVYAYDEVEGVKEWENR